MRSRLRSVSVATFAGVLWLSPHARAEESAGDPPDPAGVRKPDAPPAEEQLSDEAELARVVSLVEAAKYEECAARLSRLLDPKTPHPLVKPQVVETARLYHATCLIGLGKTEAADQPLRDALRKNPQMRAPDSLIFPPRVIDRFIKVRDELYEELRRIEREAIERARRESAAMQKQDNDRWAKMLTLERLARQEVVVHRNSRWVAMVPFGTGQFQNGNQALGWLFLGSEVALAGTALVSTAVFTHIESQTAEYTSQGRPPGADVKKRLDDWHTALVLSSYGFLGVAALGIAEAQISFVPEVRHVRERPLPKPGLASSLEPDVAIGPSAVRLGIRGSF
jgi:hypothetical protein